MSNKSIKKNIEPVNPIIFNRIFGRDKDGQAILDELNRVFYDRPSYQSSSDALGMAFREGQRSVVAHINAKTNKEE